MLYMEYDDKEIHKTQYNEISKKGRGPCFLCSSTVFILFPSRISVEGVDISMAMKSKLEE